MESHATRPITRRSGLGARVAGALAACALLLAPLPALADDHDPSESAHPLEVIATILYPVGWLVDTLVVRPLHWLAHQEPLSTVTGHETEDSADTEEE